MLAFVTGKDITAFRTKYRLTQAELADLLETTPVTISRWETGASQIQHPRIMRLALTALGRSQRIRNRLRAKQPRRLAASR